MDADEDRFASTEPCEPGGDRAPAELAEDGECRHRRREQPHRAVADGADVGPQAGVGEKDRQEKRVDEVFQSVDDGSAELGFIRQDRSEQKRPEDGEDANLAGRDRAAEQHRHQNRQRVEVQRAVAHAHGPAGPPLQDRSGDEDHQHREADRLAEHQQRFAGAERSPHQRADRCQ